VPVQEIGENAAEHDADTSPARGDEAEYSHCLRALGGLGEERHHQRERDRRRDRASDSLDRPRCNEETLARRHSAGQRGQREERDPDQEEPAVAK
jgi:hypothetical protein